MSTNQIDPEQFNEVRYNDVSLFFDKKYTFHQHFGHKLKTIRFLFYKNLISYLEANKGTRIFFTLDENIKPYKKFENGILINIDSYFEFCRSIARNTSGRARAFLGQHLTIANIPTTNKEKDDFIKVNATEENLLAAIQSLNQGSQTKLLEAMKQVVGEKSQSEDREITKEQFISSFGNFLTDKDVQVAFFRHSPKLQIETLEKLLIFLENNLDKGEDYIQKWIDEESGKYRKQRCLIFGVEYVDPKREGELNRKRFDVLAEQDREHHVLIELKSPSADVFDILTTETKNEGKATEYSLSPELARAIPQVLGYKVWYEQASPEELQKLGISNRKSISKCLIIIGKNSDDDVWRDNIQRLRESLSRIEIITYTDLIDKLRNTIQNLKENLGDGK